MTATAGGAVLIVTAYAPTASITISSVSGTESWVNPSCGNTQGAFSIDTQYALLSAPGITSYTVTLSSAPTGGWTVFMAEVATDKIAAFDVCANRLQSSTSTSIAGEIVALGGANDYIAQSIYEGGSGGTVSSIGSSYTIEQGSVTTHAYADLLNTASGAAPTWAVSVANTAILIGIAFKEVGTVGVVQAGTCSTASGTTCTISLSATTAGNLIHVSAENHTFTVTDSSTGSCPGTAVDTFAHISAADSGTNSITNWWVKTAGGATAICITASGTFTAVWAYEISGLGASVAVDQTAATGGTAPSTLTCPSVTTTNATEVVVNTVVTGSGSGNISVASPFAMRSASTVGAAYAVTASTGTYAGTFARTSATTMACSAVSYTPSPGTIHLMPPVIIGDEQQ
jgi:hypothetical protein